MRAKRYMAEYGTKPEQFANVVVKSRKHAALNPIAQYRKQVTIEEIMNSPMIADPLTRNQCCPVGDAAAAAVLCSEETVKKLATKKPVKILGCISQSGKYNTPEKLLWFCTILCHIPFSSHCIKSGHPHTKGNFNIIIFKWKWSSRKDFT